MNETLNIPNIDFGPFSKGVLSAITNAYPVVLSSVKDIVGVLVAISFPLSLFFLIVIIYCVEQLKRIRNKEDEMQNAKVVPAFEVVKENGDEDMTRRWQSVIAHISTDNENDWRQAIIDADIILDNILTRMGYQGKTVGEKLQRAAKGDFETLDAAWEAHKVRNIIAHEGSNVALNQHEAKRAFDNYKRVFEEFYYI